MYSDSVIEGGYATFFEEVAKTLSENCLMLYGKAVCEINYSRDIVEITCADKTRYFAKQVVASLPLGILKKERVTFCPPLPLDKQQSIHNLGFGLMNKVALRFKCRFWGEKTAIIRVVPMDHQAPPIFFDNSSPNCNVLVALVVDDFARQLSSMDNDRIFEYLTEFLSRSFNL